MTRGMRQWRSTRTRTLVLWSTYDLTWFDLLKVFRAIRMDITFLTTMVTFGIQFDPFFPWHILHGCHCLGMFHFVIVTWSCDKCRPLGRRVNACPQFSSNQVEVRILKIVQNIVEFVLKGGVLHECLVETSTTQGNLTCTKLFEQLGRWFSKTFENFAPQICQEIIFSKSLLNCFKVKTGSRYIFAGELGGIKSLEVSLKSISCFLVPYHHSLDDASKGSDRTTLMFGNTVEIWFYFRTKCFYHWKL